MGYTFREKRELHKAICSKCKKECEVPFIPIKDRAVYCKDCYKANLKDKKY